MINKIVVRKKLYGNVFNTYSMHKEEKSITTEIFIKTFKNKTYKYMIWISKNVYIDKLDDIVNKYNTYHSTIKMQPVEVKSNIYINSSKKINDKKPYFSDIVVGDIVRISKYKNNFCKRLQSKLA